MSLPVKSKTHLLMLGVILFSLWVGVYHLGDARISHDELKTLRLINDLGTFEVLITFLSFNHVFFSFVLDLVHALSDTFYFLRLVAVIFGVLAVTMTYRAGRTLIAARVALVAAYFLVITPIFMQYLREMRGYSATVFFGLALLYCLWQAIVTGHKRYWLGLVIAASLGVYTHLYFTLALLPAGLIVAGEWLLALRDRRPQRAILKPAIISFLAIGLILAILYTPIVGQVLAVPEEQTLREPVFGPFAPTLDFVGATIGIFTDFSPAGPSAGLDLFLLAVAVGCLSGLIDPARRRVTTWLILWWQVPFWGNLLVMALAPGSSAQIRFHLHTLPVYLLLGASGLFVTARFVAGLVTMILSSDLKRIAGQAPSFGLISIIVLALTVPGLVDSLDEKTDEAWTDVSAYLRSEAAAGDVILCEAFELHGGRGGDDGSCGWQLGDVAKLIEPSLPNQSLGRIANYRGAEGRHDILQQPGRIWFVIYFRGSPPYAQAELDQRSELTVKQFRSTWVVRGDSGATLHQNLIDIGHWLLAYIPDEKHQFDYNLALAQLYALSDDLEQANHHLEQAFAIQQASSDPDWGPELARLREVAAIVRFYAPVEPSPEHILNINFDGKVKLSGYSLEPDSLAGPAEVKLSFYWHTVGSLEQDYFVLVHLKDQAGNTVGFFDFQPFDAILPTSQWPAGTELREARRFSIPAELAPGEYTFEIGLYLPDTMHRLRIIDDTSGENVVSLGTVVIGAS